MDLLKGGRSDTITRPYDTTLIFISSITRLVRVHYCIVWVENAFKYTHANNWSSGQQMLDHFCRKRTSLFKRFLCFIFLRVNFSQFKISTVILYGSEPALLEGLALFCRDFCLLVKSLVKCVFVYMRRTSPPKLSSSTLKNSSSAWSLFLFSIHEISG